MSNIDLTTGQKLQIGFIVLVLGVAGYALFSSMRAPLDSTVNCWTLTRKYPADPTKPVSAANPYDPKKEATVNCFACYDGQLEITEYRNDRSRRTSIIWVKPDLRRKSYLYYQDPLGPVKSIKDPYNRAIALAAYSAANGRALGLLGTAQMSAEQLAAEKAAREAMNNSLALFKITLETGHFNDALMEKVMTALNECRRCQKDPMKDTEKAGLVRKVLEASSTYLKAVEAEKAKIIQKYIDKMDDILNADQKLKVAEAGKVQENRLTRFAAGGAGAGVMPANPAVRRPPVAANAVSPTPAPRKANTTRPARAATRPSALVEKPN